MSSQTKTILGTENFEEAVLKAKKPVLVDFWASWCGPCQMMAPILDELALENKNDYEIAKLDTEATENQKLVWQFQIQSIPNMKLFKDGKVIKEFVGFRPKDVLEEEMKQAIK